MKDKKNSIIYNKFVDFIKNNYGNKHFIKLTQTNPLDSFEPNIFNIVAPFYDYPDPIINRVGSVLNAIYTQQNSVFLITRDLVNDLVKNDKNHSIESCNTQIYKNMMAFLFNSNIINVLRKPIRISPGIRGRAGLYELIHPEYLNPLIQIMGVDHCHAKKDSCIKWYDAEYSEETAKPREPKTEFELEMERRARERKIKRI